MGLHAKKSKKSRLSLVALTAQAVFISGITVGSFVVPRTAEAVIAIPWACADSWGWTGAMWKLSVTVCYDYEDGGTGGGGGGIGGGGGRSGTFINNNTSSTTDKKKDKNGPCSGNHEGDPISVDTGAKLDSYPIFKTPGEMGLSFTLYYNTSLKIPQTLSNPFWTTNLQYTLQDGPCHVDKQGDLICGGVIYQRPDGSTIHFTGAPQGSSYTENGGGGLATLSYNSSTATYTLHDEDATTKTFDANGYLESITDPSGVSWTITSSSSSSGLTYTVRHSNGKSFTVLYGVTSNGVTPVTVTDPAGNQYTMQMTGAVYGSNFTSITYPGSPSTTIAFKYGLSSLPYSLTEVDYNGIPYNYTTYDSTSTDTYFGRATGEHLADNTGNSTIAYSKDSVGNLQATVTNPLGHHETLTYDGTNGSGGAYNGQLSEESNDAVSTCGATVKNRAYDANGNLSMTVDNNGVAHSYTYSTAGQLQTDTAAYGTSLARKTDYVWDSNLQLNRLTSVTVEGVRKTAYTYNAQNRLASVAVTNLTGVGTANQTLTTTYTYTLYSNGTVQSEKITHPSPNGTDADTYNYDASGNLSSVVDGLGHTTSYSGYNGLGEATHVTGPNGDVTDYVWDARGRLQSKTTHVNNVAATWSYAYDGFGLIASTVAPDGGTITWSRNSVMRVTSASHNDGGGTSTESFGYDANGDITSESIARGSDVGMSRTFVYDALGRVYQAKGANGEIVTYAYDGNGNLLSSTDVLGHAVSFQYDALNRRTLAKTPLGYQTQFQYDQADNVTKEIDPRGLTTTYSYDGFDQLWTQSSPDTGSTSFTYDAYGRLASKTFAGGLKWTLSYDGINRLTQVATSANTHLYAYDSCTNGVGRLCSASDSNGATSVSYTYLPQGMVASRSMNVGGTAYSLSYTYDSSGRLQNLTYPDGNKASYSYVHGSVSNVSLTLGGVSANAASNVTYRPFDMAMSGWTSGNGLGNSMGYDADLRTTSVSVPGVQSLAVGYDTASRITKITNGVTSSLTQTFGYDADSRLTSVSSTADNEVFGYDSAGNRTSQTTNGTSVSYSPAATSNRLTSWSSGGNTVQLGYDAQGNQQSQSNTGGVGSLTGNFVYGYFNRLQSVTKNGVTTTYSNDAEGDRLSKSGSASGTVYFAPDSKGNLMAENDGGVWKDYVWLNGRLISLTQSGQTYAVHDDQLGRPEAMTDSAKSVVWRAQNLAFGRTVTVSNGPSLNVGFPGQYYDAETGLWYNQNRYYDSMIGRYVQSDPIGLSGGVNTYSYTANNPVSYSDPQGQELITAIVGGVFGAVAGYEAAGWRGAVVGGLVGGAVGFFAPMASRVVATAAVDLLGGGATTTAIAATATNVAIGGGGGAAATLGTNLLYNATSSCKRGLSEGMGYGIALGAMAPLMSGEAFLGGAEALGGEEVVGTTGKGVFAGLTGGATAAGEALDPGAEHGVTAGESGPCNCGK